MKKGIKHKLVKVVLPSLCILSLAIVLLVQYVSNAEAVTTIDDYETEDITTYLGYGYNVVKKDYINADDVTKSNTIFNIVDKETSSGSVQGIRDTSIVVDNASNKTETYYINARSIESFISKFTSKFTARANVTDSKKWAPFSANVVAEASSSLENTHSTQKKTEYVKDIREVKSGTAIWTVDESEYYGYLSENFKRDVLHMEPTALFDKYGTHFLRSVVLGGRLELNAQIEANSTENLTKAVTSFKTTIDVMNASGEEQAEGQAQEGSDGKKNASLESELSASIEDLLKTANIEISSTCYGGEAKDFTSYINTTVKGVFSADNQLNTDALIGNTSYGSTYAQWLTTVSKSPALVDIYDEDSLYPIWDLLDYFVENDETLDADEVMERKAELKETFEEYGMDNYNKIISDFKSSSDSMYAVVDSTLTGVKDATSYNKNYKLKEEETAIHKDYKLGNVLITNAVNNDDGTVSSDAEVVQVMYQLTQDRTGLPVGDSNYASHRLLHDGDYVKRINGYGKIMKGIMVGKGAYYVQVVYKDQTTVSKSDNNILKKMNKGDSVVLFETDASEADKHGGIDKINVVFIYETQGITKKGFPKTFNWIEEAEAEFR